MVKLKNQHSEEDEQILEEIGREILVNPNKVQFVMKKLRFEAHGTDAFEK